MYVSPWNGRLVLLDLPTDEHAEVMHIYNKHLEGDSFERVKEDGTQGYVITFVKDKDGAIALGGLLVSIGLFYFLVRFKKTGTLPSSEEDDQ